MRMLCCTTLYTDFTILILCCILHACTRHLRTLYYTPLAYAYDTSHSIQYLHYILTIYTIHSCYILYYSLYYITYIHYTTPTSYYTLTIYYITYLHSLYTTRHTPRHTLHHIHTLIIHYTIHYLHIYACIDGEGPI